MTLRDYFAAKALQGMIASETHGEGMIPSDITPIVEAAANRSYEFADAMLKERNKE